MPSVTGTRIDAHVPRPTIQLRVDVVRTREVRSFFPFACVVRLLARGVGSMCAVDEECGGNMRCEGKQCQCGSGQQEEATTDLYTRPITRCVSGRKSVSFFFPCANHSACL